MNNSNLDNRKSSTGRNQKKSNAKDEMSPMAGRLMLILGYMQEFQGALNLKDLYNSAIDAVLSITGMDRGYGFLIEYNQDQMSLKEVTSRKKGKDFFEKDYTISKSMLKKVIKANGAVLIDNADTSIESTMSMRDFKIKSLVCLPLMLYDKETKKENFYNLFDTLHDPETKQYYGEDFGFCQRWTDIGGKVYGYIDDPITHVGEYCYTGRFRDDLWQAARPVKSVDEPTKIK